MKLLTFELLKFFKTLINHYEETRSEHHHLFTMLKNILNANGTCLH